MLARIYEVFPFTCPTCGGAMRIIDYKTQKVGAGETAMQESAERHRAQIERYAAVFRADGLSIHIAVFHAAVSELVELEMLSQPNYNMRINNDFQFPGLPPRSPS